MQEIHITNRKESNDMGHLKIHCDSCGTDWIVYHRDIQNAKAKTCPMCGQSICRQTWNNQILPAFGMMEDCNRELYKDHCGQHGTLFTVSYVPEVIYPNKSDIYYEIDELKEALAGFKNVMLKVMNTLSK